MCCSSSGAQTYPFSRCQQLLPNQWEQAGLVHYAPTEDYAL